MMLFTLFFFNDTATTEIYTLSLHDALPIWVRVRESDLDRIRVTRDGLEGGRERVAIGLARHHVRNQELASFVRSEEHTSELQSRQYLVCRLLLEKKKTKKRPSCYTDIPIHV